MPNFYPRPPRGGRHTYSKAFSRKSYISIHALREEGDLATPPSTNSPLIFLSTPSARRATLTAPASASAAGLFLSTPSARRATHSRSPHGDVFQISIHALREEGDFTSLPLYELLKLNFYPRPPRGGRRPAVPMLLILLAFLSTPSARRATHGNAPFSRRSFNFYPRPPRGGRLSASLSFRVFRSISIHALREEGDDYRLVKLAKFDEFLSTPSARRATLR